MKKIALNVEELRVDLYETTIEETSERGTVEAHPIQKTTQTYEFSCVGTSCIRVC